MADSQLPDLSPEALDRPPAEGLLGLLTSLQREVTRDLIDVCVARQAEMAPLLRAFVEDDSTWDPEASDGVWWGIVHAVFVLGQTQGAEAAAGLVGALRRMDDATADAPWDWLDGYWPAQFRGKREHARVALRALALDSAANHQARSIACDCLLDDAQEQGGDALESTLDWLVDRVSDPDEHPDLRGGVGSSLLSFPRPRHREALERAGREAPGSVFPYFVLDDVLQAYRKASPPDWQTHFADPLSFYASEALDAYRARRKSQGSTPMPSMAERTPAPARTHAQRGVTVAPRAHPHSRKIGRNEPCPCGSGKKHKKCCGR